MITDIDIVDAFEKLKGATAGVFVTAADVLAAKVALAKKKEDIQLTIDPKDLGSNEVKRAAATNAMCKEEIDALDAMEKRERAARLNFELAELEVDKVKNLIRLMAINSVEN